MQISVLTIFPQMFQALSHSLLGKAQQTGTLKLNVIDIRDFSTNKHRKTDDYPFGGGSGMVMMVQPIMDAVDYARSLHQGVPRRIYLSPRGRVFHQSMVQPLAQQDLILLCGHYEGVDQRAIDSCMDEELSIGDYVLTGGELPAMVVIDAISRYVDGVIGNEASLEEESFGNGLLEYPQYTRPAEYRGMGVPDVLLSGHHANIKKWQREQALEITRANRPDLLEDI